MLYAAARGMKSALTFEAVKPVPKSSTASPSESPAQSVTETYWPGCRPCTGTRQQKAHDICARGGESPLPVTSLRPGVVLPL